MQSASQRYVQTELGPVVKHVLKATIEPYFTKPSLLKLVYPSVYCSANQMQRTEVRNTRNPFPHLQRRSRNTTHSLQMMMTDYSSFYTGRQGAQLGILTQPGINTSEQIYYNRVIGIELSQHLYVAVHSQGSEHTVVYIIFATL